MQEEAILDLFAYGEWLPRFMADTGTAWKNMEPEDVPEWFDQHFPSGCARCKRGGFCGVKLNRCARCRLVRYCSPKCQQADWGRHKKLCKHVKLFEEYLSSPDWGGPDWKGGGISKDEWREIIACGMDAVRQRAVSKAGEDLAEDPLADPQVLDQWMLQRHCSVCFCSGASQTRELVECPKCCSAFHCKECEGGFEAAHSLQACESNAISLAAFAMSVEQGTPLILSSSSRTTASGQQDIPSGWSGYFAEKRNDFHVPEELLRLAPVTAMLAEGLSMPMTIASALSRSYGADALDDMREISVHVIGVGDAEIAGGHKYHETVHWFQGCKRLRISLVGYGVEEEEEEVGGCLGCDSEGCKVTMSVHNSTYAAWSGSSDPPHLVIVCLAGIGGIPEEGGGDGAPGWEDGDLGVVARQRAPWCLVAGTKEEIGEAVNLLASYGPAPAQGKTQGKTSTRDGDGGSGAEGQRGGGDDMSMWRNPYRGLLPRPLRFCDGEFWYSNNYCALFGGALQKIA